MKKILKNKFHTTMVITALLIVFIISFSSVSLAWIAAFRLEKDFSAVSITHYFAGGDGTAENPYIINQPVHLYNLSWLQSIGFFDRVNEETGLNEKEYFRISDTTPSGAPVVIDMGGKMGGSGSTSGAIPPIGTYEYPFKGEIDGRGSVIKNLWVSTKSQDWIECPENATDYSSDYVGLFGSIGESAIVENFVLDRLEVKTHIDSVVGLVCGYVDAKLSNVGVFNGIITTENVQNCSTKYSLVGDISEDVNWIGMPSIGQDGEGGSGGELVVAPAGEMTNTVINKAVPNALSGTAYYASVKAQNVTSTGTLYDLTTSAHNAIDSTYINGIADERTRQRMQDVYDAVMVARTPTAQMLTMTDVPFAVGSTTPKATVQVTDENNQNIYIPANGVWFKPKTTGTAALSFKITNWNDSRYMMIYRIRRISATQVSLVSATEFTMLKTYGFNNGDAVYFEHVITQDDIDNNYEMVIGVSRDHPPKNTQQYNSCGFMYFRLAGTSEDEGTLPGHGSGGDGGITKVIADIDYVTMDEVQTPPENVTPIVQTILSFDQQVTGATTINGSVYYLATVNLGQQSGVEHGTTVNYYSTVSPALTVTDSASLRESNLGNANLFYERNQTSSGEYTKLVP